MDCSEQAPASKRKMTVPSSAVRSYICCLCGETIDSNPRDPQDALSWDHVPPKQFYPKEIRAEQRLNLWRVPTHKCCNQLYREDEEYFYCAMSTLVYERNPETGQLLYRDFKRRAQKPQTPALMRRILSTFTTVTEGGVRLPRPIVQFSIEGARRDRVVLKIAQGLHYLDYGRYLPRDKCIEVRQLDGADVPEPYRTSWSGLEPKTVCPEVFSYIDYRFEGVYLCSMLFWEAFMLCTAFQER